MKDPVFLIRCRSCGMKFETKAINSKCPLCARRKVKTKDEAETASRD